MDDYRIEATREVVTLVAELMLREPDVTTPEEALLWALRKTKERRESYPNKFSIMVDEAKMTPYPQFDFQDFMNKLKPQPAPQVKGPAAGQDFDDMTKSIIADIKARGGRGGNFGGGFGSGGLGT